jgi:hypothetical protein
MFDKIKLPPVNIRELLNSILWTCSLKGITPAYKVAARISTFGYMEEHPARVNSGDMAYRFVTEYHLAGHPDMRSIHVDLVAATLIRRLRTASVTDSPSL